ncbi:Sulfotransferase 1C3 [Halotydeus destructor]|nr:Sulfotransferase 1C3 [Halotydeus destructor]
MEEIFHVVDGLKLLKLFPEENAIFGLNYKAEDEDVFVATYPKSGTTWTLQIISLIMHDGNIPNDDLDGNGMFLEAQGPVKLAQLKRPFLIGTHLPKHKLAWNSEAKYVVVARSPKDVLVSYYHHLTGQFQLTMDIHEFRKLWLDGALSLWQLL